VPRRPRRPASTHAVRQFLLPVTGGRRKTRRPRRLIFAVPGRHPIDGFESPFRKRSLRMVRAPAPSRHDQAEAPDNSEERLMTEMPRSQLARIRVWAEYGMTAAQVAAAYGVAVGTIERILRQT
jgi:hypothetical protein